MKYFLTSERLGFRHWTEDDLQLAIDLWCNPQVTALIGGPWTTEQARARLQQEIEQGNKNGMQYWPIFLLHDGQHVGCAGLRPYEQKIYEVGVHLLPTFWVQGLAAEAARSVIRYGFDVLGAEALFAGHHPHNEGSRRLLSKLGFAYRGEQLYIPTGLMHPTYLLSRE